MASSSTSSIEKSYQYDVFLSFRGEDTRKSFVDHLYAALHHQGIHTYKDDKRLDKGRMIDKELIKSMEDSKFFIIVFSKNYASSSWCLDELVKILECHKTNKQTAYPLFYDVEPTEVRKQFGAVKKAFAKHATKKAARKWREALEEAGNLAGWVLRNTDDGHEAKFINRIVEHLSLELRSLHSTRDEMLIGMEARIHHIESSLVTVLDDVRMIGIKGIGGGGKTTLARAVFDKICGQFEGKSFVENVREVSKAYGLQLLQKQVLSDILKDQGITISSVHDGTNMMKNRLHGKKVLVVLDDVDHISQLEALAGSPNWFEPGSRIIITTRDEQVLTAHKVKWIHDVNLLSDDEAICLFNRYAFGREIPTQRYKKLSFKVVHYAAGLPLTIKVLGSFLCGKNELEWIDALERLKTIPLKETLEKLELSYESLEDDYKEIFLDVACLLKGMLKDDALRILESCGFHARNGLRVLEQKSLIIIIDYQYLGMHDHIEEMGRNIVRRSQPDEPNKHSRLWIREEIENILANDLGTDATKGLALNIPLEIGPEAVTKGFGGMKKLRYLSLESSKYPCWNEDINQVSPNFPDALKCLRLINYSRLFLPKTFQANNLVALEMPYSKIVRLFEWGEIKVLNKLKFLDLHGSMKLRILDLSVTPNLERLDLRKCYHLTELHMPIVCLKRLVYLNLHYCLRVKSFAFIKQLESLEVLDLSDLYLREFPDIILTRSNNSLVELNLSSNIIEKLPSSIANLHKLVSLDLSFCKILESLPLSICSLQCLRTLRLHSCNIEELPMDLHHLEYLETLCLSCTRIKFLPDSICMLKHLKTLLLQSCEVLERLPEDLGRIQSLEKLDLSSCEVCNLKHLRKFALLERDQLEKVPEKVGYSRWLEELKVANTGISHLPQSISLLKNLKIYGFKSND